MLKENLTLPYWILRTARIQFTMFGFWSTMSLVVMVLQTKIWNIAGPSVASFVRSLPNMVGLLHHWDFARVTAGRNDRWLAHVVL